MTTPDMSERLDDRALAEAAQAVGELELNGSSDFHIAEAAIRAYLESLATPVPGAVSHAMVERVKRREFNRWYVTTFADQDGKFTHMPKYLKADLWEAYQAGRAALEAAVQSPPIVGVRGSNHSLSFEDGLFTIKADGSGEISFKDDALDWGDGEDHDWRSQKLHASEVSAIRDWLNRSTSAPPLAAPVEAALDDNGEIDLRDCLFWLENTEGFGNLDEVHTLATFVRRHISAAPVEAGATEPVAKGGLLYRPLEFDDWGMIRTADGKAFAAVRRPLSEEEAASHRVDKTDPFEDLARRLISTFAAPTGDSGALREAPTVEQLRQAAIDKGWLSTLDGIDRIVADLRLAIPSKGDLGK
jgi:hypothetical protein